VNGLIFHPDTDFNGVAKIDIRVDDQGNTGAPDPNAPSVVSSSITVNVSAPTQVVGEQIGSVINGLPNQRSVIDRLVVSFGDSLSVHPDSAFTLTRNGTDAVPVHVPLRIPGVDGVLGDDEPPPHEDTAMARRSAV
jgi:hypothetical protein